MESEYGGGEYVVGDMGFGVNMGDEYGWVNMEEVNMAGVQMDVPNHPPPLSTGRRYASY